MKLTTNNIKALRRDSDNKLFRHVCSWVIQRWSDYSDKTYIFRDVLEHGCVSGIVSELIWYSDTLSEAFNDGQFDDETYELNYYTGSEYMYWSVSMRDDGNFYSTIILTKERVK